MNDFIRSSEEIKAATLVIDDLSYILAKYVNANQDFERIRDDGSSEVAEKSISELQLYPDSIETLHYNLIYEIYDRMQEIDSSDKISETPEQKAFQDNSDVKENLSDVDYSDDMAGDAIHGMIFANGYLNIYGISEIALMNRRVHFYSVQLFRRAANDFYKDVLFIKFACLKREKPFLRIAIGAFYAIGFGLLLIPTLKTSFLIFRSLLS